MHDLRMAAPALCAWVVAVVAVTSGSSTAAVISVSAIGLAVAGTLKKHGSAYIRIFVVCAVAIAGVSAMSAWRLVTIEHSPLASLASAHRMVTVTAAATSDAKHFAQHGDGLIVFTAKVHQLDSRKTKWTMNTPVTVFAKMDGEPDRESIQMGESTTIVGRLSPAKSSDIAAELNTITMGPIRHGAWWWSASSTMRSAVTESVSRSGAEPAALIPALVHGDTQLISNTVREDFRRTGLTHLLAVSGTNLTIVLATLLVIGRAIGIRRRGQWILGACAIVGFVILARPDPSVLRAAAMGSVGLAGLGYGSRGGVRALSWAVIALMLIDPWLSRSLGFVLSVCATAGILVLGPPFTRALSDHLPRPAAIAVAVPLAAQLACTPVIAAFSGRVSLVAVFANLAAGPAVAPATVAGLVGGIVGLISPAASHVVGQLAGLCGRWILFVADQCAALPGASSTWNGPLWLIIALCCLVALAVHKMGTRPVMVWGVSLGLVACLWRPPSPGWPPTGWVMVACDVGQGDATVLNTGADGAVVIDAGPDPELMNRCLSGLGVDHIKLMVFTHGHADHIDGWPGLRRHRTVDEIMVGPTGGPKESNVPRHRAVLGERFSVGNASFQVLGPEAMPTFNANDVDGTTANNASIVLLASVGGVRLMLAGDAEPEEQKKILADFADVRADVLKMPHHGSARQLEEFFAAVGASLATISDGKGNDYGHPAPSALTLLRKQHMDFYRTDRKGDIAIVSKKGGIRVVTR